MSGANAQRRSSDTGIDNGANVFATRRFFDAASGSWMVKVFPGEFFVTSRPDEVLVTVLGSCVSACIRDPRTGIGGIQGGYGPLVKISRARTHFIEAEQVTDRSKVGRD